ncbi:MAG: 4Fe-4S dicluster domain-containing protein [Desulforhopalus sp.]|nr:4Fe-4S dicluster domain-containing protein [Desulforhopalus sp.]
MKMNDLEKVKSEDLSGLRSSERRKFLGLGLAITGMYLGGTVLSLTPVKSAEAIGFENVVPVSGKYPYAPHYTMVLREHLCIDCERCMEACVAANHVPEYGSRTTILETQRPLEGHAVQTTFTPVLCNQCNNPPCVRVCPTSATFKDEKTGIVRMINDLCIGCKACMAACPYDARYFNEEPDVRAVDKCDFCWESRLSKGETTTACAEACPTGCRVFGDLADETSDVYVLLHAPETTIWVLRPESGALPNVYYINK